MIVYVWRMLTPEIKYVSEIKYLKYQQLLREIAVLECENAKFLKLARSARSHKFHTFSQCKRYTVVYI